MPKDFFARQGRGREGVALLRRTASDTAWREKTRHGPEGLVRRFLTIIGTGGNLPSRFSAKNWRSVDKQKNARYNMPCGSVEAFGMEILA